LYEPNNFAAWHKTIGIVALVLVSRQFDCPIGELEVERVLPFAAPSFSNSASFENYVFSSELTEIIAHRQPSMTAADDNRFNPFVHWLDARTEQ
jgi:hypothetical protein